MGKLFISTVIIAIGLLVVGVGAQGLELEAGVSFNTVTMDYVNKIIDTYNVRTGMGIPGLKSGLGLFGSVSMGLTPSIDLGLGLESISASASTYSERGDLVSFATSAFGFLGIGSWAVLQGGLQLLASAALGWYSASYSSDLEGIEAEGSGIGYKLGVILGLRLARNLSLDAILDFRGLAINELTDQGGHILSVRGRPYLDFSGFELGLGVRLSF